jgi:hypothetical protein
VRSKDKGVGRPGVGLKFTDRNEDGKGVLAYFANEKANLNS